MKTLQGTGVALVTPFNKEGDVDVPALERLVHTQVENGIDYLVVLGTTAETPTLSTEEKELVKMTVKKANKGRLPMVLGVGGNNTQTIVEQVREVSSEDYTAILSVTPYYNKPSQEGIYQHFSTLARRSSLPIVLYNVPGRVGVNMAPDTVIRLAQGHENIIGVKEASGFPQQAEQITSAELPKDFVVLSGDDALTVAFVQNGAQGVISVVGNAYPRLTSRLTHLAMQGRYNEADMLQTAMRQINTQLFQEGNPAGIKALLRLMCLIDSDTLRLPLVPVSEELRVRLDETRKELDLYASTIGC